MTIDNIESEGIVVGLGNSGTTGSLGAETANNQDPIYELQKEVARDKEILRQLSADLYKKNEELGKEQAALRGKQEELENAQEQLKSSQEELRNAQEEFKRDKVSHIEILGIFVAIFAFLSIEFQILKEVTDFVRITGLSILIFSSVLFFITNLSIIADRWIDKGRVPGRSLRSYNIMAIILLILGVTLVWAGDYRNPADIENNDSFKELKAEVSYQKNIINTLESEIDDARSLYGS